MSNPVDKYAAQILETLNKVAGQDKDIIRIIIQDAVGKISLQPDIYDNLNIVDILIEVLARIYAKKEKSYVVDKYNAYVSIADYIADALKKHMLASKNSGFCWYPHDFGSYEEWEKAMRHMWEVFDEIRNDYPKMDKIFKCKDIGIGVDKEKYDEYKRWLDEGLMLFAKYMPHLWV